MTDPTPTPAALPDELARLLNACSALLAAAADGEPLWISHVALRDALAPARAAAEGLAERVEAKQRGADALRECLEIEHAGRKDAEAERGLAEMRAYRWKRAAKAQRFLVHLNHDAALDYQQQRDAALHRNSLYAQDVARWQAARLHEHQRAEALAEHAEQAAGRLRAIIALIEDPRSVGAEHFDTGAVYDAILEDARAAIAALEVKP
jgi:hypothetical protein